MGLSGLGRGSMGGAERASWSGAVRCGVDGAGQEGWSGAVRAGAGWCGWCGKDGVRRERERRERDRLRPAPCRVTPCRQSEGGPDARHSHNLQQEGGSVGSVTQHAPIESTSGQAPKAEEPLHAVTRRYTPLHAVTCRYMPLHAVTEATICTWYAVTEAFGMPSAWTVLGWAHGG